MAFSVIFIQGGELVGVGDIFVQLCDGFVIAFRRFDHGGHFIAHTLEIVDLLARAIDHCDFLTDVLDIAQEAVKFAFQPTH